MKTEDPASPYFEAYIIIWVILAISSWLKIRSCGTPQEKKKWFDRLCIIMGIFVTGFICAILVIWKQYLGIPLFAAFGIGIAYLNIRNTFFCTCGKQSLSQNWFSKSFHCPHCGEKLR
jgi:glucan phosphoethanolaminetransferase (alkaline phosphatase superfamily)